MSKKVLINLHIHVRSHWMLYGRNEDVYMQKEIEFEQIPKLISIGGDQYEPLYVIESGMYEVYVKIKYYEGVYFKNLLEKHVAKYEELGFFEISGSARIIELI